MAFEVELKAHVADRDACRRRLLSVCGGDMTDEWKEDVYYALPGGPALFRIRFERYGNGEGNLLFTSKEKTIRDGVEVNREHEFVASGRERENAYAFAASLGYVVYVSKVKRGESCHIPLPDFVPLHVELVEVPPLGWFVEMEFLVEDEKNVSRAKALLHEVLAHLGIPESSIEGKYYMDMLRAPSKERQA